MRNKLGDDIRHTNVELHRPAGCSTLERIDEFAPKRKNLIGVTIDDLPRFSELEVSADTRENLVPQRFFKGPDLRGDRGLLEIEAFAGGGDGSFACDDPEVEQVMVIEPIHAIPSYANTSRKSMDERRIIYLPMCCAWATYYVVARKTYCSMMGVVTMQMQLSARNFKMKQDLHDLVERRLQFALGRFSSRIKRVRLVLSDENGPRGGIDKKCLIEVSLVASGKMLVEVTDAEIEPAVSRAADRIARRVNDELDRRRDTRRRGKQHVMDDREA